MKTRKEVSLYVSDGQQIARIAKDDMGEGITLTSIEVEDDLSFKLFLTHDEVYDLASALTQFSQEIKNG